MTESGKPTRRRRSMEYLAIEEAEAVRLAEQAKVRAKISGQVRPAVDERKPTKFKPDAFAETADRIERRAQRASSDRAAAKRRAKDKAAECPLGPKVVIGTRIVPDPLEVGARIRALVNLAEHPLEMMLARRRLTQAQYEAGIRFRLIFERASIGPGRGVDPAKIKVDGGRFSDPLSDQVVNAQLELSKLARKLGGVGEKIVRSIAGEGMSLGELARIWPSGDSEKLKIAYLGPRFREALDLLATEVWGARGFDHGDIVSARGLGSGVVDDRAVAVANQTYLRKRGIAV